MRSSTALAHQLDLLGDVPGVPPALSRMERASVASSPGRAYLQSRGEVPCGT